MDKRRIFGNLHNLNQQRRLSQQIAVYITEHLPKQFQENHKQLLHVSQKLKEYQKKISGRQKMNTMLCILITSREIALVNCRMSTGN